MRRTLLFAVFASACSFSNTNTVNCTDDTDCATAFGADSVCLSDGLCSKGAAGTDGGTDSVGETPWTFVSFPDFLNADIGDISALSTAVTSTNAAHEAAIGAVLDALAAHQPDFVMVAGDLVNGHWYSDASGVQVFGPVGTLAEKRAAVTLAGDLYYGQWKKRFTDRGLEVYAALGDHDIGDNDWPAGQDKSFLVPTYKEAWAKHFTRDGNGMPVFQTRPVGTPFEHTAYAVRHKNVLVVTVDEFRQDDPAVAIDSKTGSVRNDVVGEQLAWLESVLAAAANDPLIDHVIVQGHVPVLLPVRRLNSSGLTMPESGESDFWQALSRNKVDLYFAGEVHDMSAANYLGVEQVVHGGIMGYAPRVSYVVGRVYSDRIELELKSADLVYPSDDTTRLWQAGSNRPRAQYSISPNGFSTVGTLVIDKSGGSTQYLDRSGYFIPIGSTAAGMVVHLPLDETGGTTAVNYGTSGATNNGTVESATFVAGKIGNGLAFDNLDRVVAGMTPVTGTQARTTSVWIRTAPAAVVRTVFSLGTNAGGGKWDVDIDATGLFELGIGQGRTDATGSTPVADNTWHNLVTVLPAGTTSLSDVRMYVDGNPINFTAPATAASIDTKAGNLLIGQSVNAQATQQLTGTVDDLSIWATELDPGEVRAIYSFGSEPTLAYDASAVQSLLGGFAAQQDVTVSGRLWRYQASGLTGMPGQVVVSGSSYAVNLGGGAGFVSP